MSTPPAPGTARPSRHPLDRLAGLLLDPDSSVYGDERERLHWYEAYTVVALVQWLIVPWTMAVLVWVGGRPVVGYLLVALVAFYLPIPLVLMYIARKQIRLAPVQGGRWRIAAVLVALPYLIFGVGALRAYGRLRLDDPSEVLGMLTGAAVGAAVVGGGMVLLERRRRRRTEHAEDGD